MEKLFCGADVKIPRPKGHKTSRHRHRLKSITFASLPRLPRSYKLGSINFINGSIAVEKMSAEEINNPTDQRGDEGDEGANSRHLVSQFSKLAYRRFSRCRQ